MKGVDGVEGRYRRKIALEEHREMAAMFYHIRNRDGRSGSVTPVGPGLGLDWLPSIDGATPFESWDDCHEHLRYFDLEEVAKVEGVAE